MSFNVAMLKAMQSEGLSLDACIRVLEAGEKKADPTNAVRQARHRARRKSNAVTVTHEPPYDNISTPTTSDEVVAATPKTGARLADNFTAPAEWIEWAMEKRGWSRVEAVDEAECFARYWQAKDGRDAKKRDWFKTWQNWVANSRRATLANPPFSRPSADPPSYLQHVLDQSRRRVGVAQ